MTRSPGGGSAIATALVFCLLMVQYEVAQAATFTVGGARGWTFNVESWARGRRYRVGDKLYFNYNPRIHNVVAVNKLGFDTCSTPSGATVYNSGKDVIPLVRGQNYFICNWPGHCQAAMKIAVTAL